MAALAGPRCFLHSGPRASGRLWQLSWLDGPDGEGVDALKSVADPSGELLRVELKNGDKITNVTFGPQQQILLSTQPGHIFLLDLSKNRYRRVGSLGKVTCIALDGKEGVKALVGLEGGNGKVLLLDCNTGAVRGRLAHSGEVEWVGFSQGGKLGVGMGKRGATVWSLKQNISINRLMICDEGSDLGCVRLLRGAGEFKYRIVSGSVDGKVAIWGAVTAIAPRGEKQLQVIHHFQEECQCDAIEVSGESIFIGCSSGLVKQYSLESGLLLSTTPVPPHIRLTGLSVVANVLVLHDVGGLVFLKLSSGTILAKMANCGRGEFSNCGRLMARVRDGGEMLLYKMEQFLPRVESSSKPAVGEKEKETKNKPSNSKKSCDKPASVLSENAVNINRGPSMAENLPKEVLKVSSDEAELILDNFTREKLLPMLRSICRGFPSRHRELIWCQILAVPRNKKAFASLQRLGPHPSLPLESSIILSSVLHWSPSLSLLPYIPPFLTPFINLFSCHPRAGFEVCLSILTNYCLNWWSHVPEPPPTAKEAWQLLEKEDYILKSHLDSIGCSVRGCMWPILQTGWSTLLPGPAWSTLWDHLVVGTPSLLPPCLASTLITLRPHLMACTSSHQVSRLLGEQQTIEVSQLLQTAYAIQEHNQISPSVHEGLVEGRYPNPIVLQNQKEIIAGEKAAGSKIYVETKMSKHESKRIKDALRISPPPIPRIQYNLYKAKENELLIKQPQNEQFQQFGMNLPNFDKKVSKTAFSEGTDVPMNPIRPLQPLYPTNSTTKDGSAEFLANSTTKDESREFLAKIHQNTNGIDEAVLLLDKAKFIRGLLTTN